MKNTALLVIDVINDCCHEKCEKGNITFKKIRKMVPKLKKFIAEYKKKGGNVIYINCTPWTREHLAENIIELYKDPECRYYSEPGFPEEFYKVKPDPEDLIITKNTYDAFTNAKLDKFLKRKNIQYVLVAGVFGDGCVMSTIQGGFSKGYNFIILKDLIETTDLKKRQKIQKLLKEYTWPMMFGRTMDSDEFLRSSSQSVQF